MYKIDCLKCGKPFESKNDTASHCPKCKMNKQKALMKTVVIYNCGYCGKEFEPTKSQIYRHANTCRECREEKPWYRDYKRF